MDFHTHPIAGIRRTIKALKWEVAGLGILLVSVTGTLWVIPRLDSLYAGQTIHLVAETPGMQRGQGGWKPRVIRVKAGQPVTLGLTSRDVTHGFLLPALGIKAGPIAAGDFHTIRFVPQRPGVYPFYCYILCGPRHGAMNGRLVVEE